MTHPVAETESRVNWSEGARLEAERLVREALDEDVGSGDRTTLWTVEEGALAEGRVVTKEPIVVAGTAVAERTFLAVDSSLEVEVVIPDGERAESGDRVLQVRGPARGILTGERVALNFLGRLSGIATLTRRYVDEVAGTGARITETRKTTPGWRHLEKWAVRLGGGWNHRMGLYDMVLVKDNHEALAGGVGEAVRRVLERNDEDLEVEVEVRDLRELSQLQGLPVARILLDNMPPERMAEAARAVARWEPPVPQLEASGNVTLAGVRMAAETGVEWISVGALTHSAPCADLSLQLGPVGG